MRSVPDRLKQYIAEAQREQILHRFLAQIMVDAKNAIFGESGGNRVVDMAAGFKIGTQRFFKSDARFLTGQPALLQTCYGWLKQRWGG